MASQDTNKIIKHVNGKFKNIWIVIDFSKLTDPIPGSSLQPMYL